MSRSSPLNPSDEWGETKYVKRGVKRKAARTRRNEEKPLGYAVNKENVGNTEAHDPHLSPPPTVIEPGIHVAIVPQLISKKFVSPGGYLPGTVHQHPDRQKDPARNSPNESVRTECPAYARRW